MIQIIVKSRSEKDLRTFLSSTKHPFEGHEVLCSKYVFCSNTPKGTKWKFIFSWKEINWHVLQIAIWVISVTQFGLWFLKKVLQGTHFLDVVVHEWPRSLSKQGIQTKLCTRISNSFSPLKLLSCVLVIFINMSTYILSEGRKFKTFWKEKAIALDSCYLLIKKLLNMELNILIVLMEFACIRHSWTLQQIWWIPCNLRRWWIY